MKNNIINIRFSVVIATILLINMVFAATPRFTINALATEVYSEMDLTNIEEDIKIYHLSSSGQAFKDAVGAGKIDETKDFGFATDGSTSSVQILNDANFAVKLNHANWLHFDGSSATGDNPNNDKTGTFRIDVLAGENNQNGFIRYTKLCDYLSWDNPRKPRSEGADAIYTVDNAVSDPFGEKAGVYTIEYRLSTKNLFTYETARTYYGSRGIKLIPCSMSQPQSASWKFMRDIDIFSDSVYMDGSKKADFVISDEDVINIKMVFDTRERSYQYTLTNETTGETDTISGTVVHNPESFDVIAMRFYDAFPKDTSVDILGLRMYKGLASPSVADGSLDVKGETIVGKTLTLDYQYIDNANERLSSIDWFTTTDATGETGLESVKTSTYSKGDSVIKRQYVISSEDAGKYIVAQVTPNSVVSKPFGSDLGVAPGEPKKIVAGLVKTHEEVVQDKLGDIREFDGEDYYQVYDLSILDVQTDAVISSKTGNADAQYNNDIYTITNNADGDSVKADVRLFGLNGQYTSVSASDYIINLDIVADLSDDAEMDIAVLDKSAVEIAKSGIKDGKYYTSYIDVNSGEETKLYENLSNGVEKTIQIRLNKEEKTISSINDYLTALDAAENIKDITDLLAIRFNLISGTGNVQIKKLNVLIPADEVLQASFEASMATVGFHDDRPNLAEEDLNLPVEGYLGSRIQWRSTDESIISNTGICGMFDEMKNVQLIAELRNQYLEDAGYETTMTKTYDFILNALALSETDLLDDCQILASVNSGAAVNVHDKTELGGANIDSYWSAGTDGEAYIQFDLKSVKPVNTYMFYGENLDSVEFTASQDGRIWNNIELYTTQEISEISEKTETVKNIRYLRANFPAGSDAKIYNSGLYFNPTLADNVSIDFANMNLNLPYVITENLTLPIRAEKNSIITWTSSHPSIISSTGALLDKPTADTIVLLTYTVASPADTSIYKSESVRVLVEGTGSNTGNVVRPGNGSQTSSKPNKSGGGALVVPPNPTQTQKPVEPNTPVASETFADIFEAEWARGYIERLKKEGVVSGYEDNTFRPTNYVTREEFIQMVVNCFDITATNGKSEFSDVREGAWYYDAVMCAVENELIQGITDTVFGVSKNISRQDMSVIVSRLLTKLGIEVYGENISFNDKHEISDYAQEAVAKLVAAGILDGNPDGNFYPENGATRAEISKVLCVLSDYVSERAE